MNSRIRVFALRVGVFYVLWYLIYELCLKPKGSLDLWLSLNISGVVAGVLQSWGFDSFAVFRTVGLENSYGIEIIDGCNALSSMALYSGFIWAYPVKHDLRYAVLLIGVGIIYIINIYRLAFLAMVSGLYPQLMEFFHSYSTNLIFYVIIFILWAGYISVDKHWRGGVK